MYFKVSTWRPHFWILPVFGKKKKSINENKSISLIAWLFLSNPKPVLLLQADNTPAQHAYFQASDHFHFP